MPNPYTKANHNPFLDYEIWERGVQGGGGERDFLRELHSLNSLRIIKTELERALNIKLARVSSIWIDKSPLCQVKVHSQFSSLRELGDLAIVVRKNSPSGYFERMWILQGKKYSPNWHTRDESTKKEIELYEKCPEFEVFTSARNGRSMGTFDLKVYPGFGNPPYPANPLPFWNYLLFECRSSSAAHPISHIRHSWPSSSSNEESFTQGLVNMAKNTGQTNLNYGADVAPKTVYPTWRRLYLTLWRHTGAKLATPLPGGPWRNSALNFDTILDSKVASSNSEECKTTGFEPSVRNELYTAAYFKFRKAVHQDLDNIPPPPDGGDSGGEDDGGGMNFLILDIISEE